jgi:hypothetical protein
LRVDPAKRHHAVPRQLGACCVALRRQTAPAGNGARDRAILRPDSGGTRRSVLRNARCWSATLNLIDGSVPSALASRAQVRTTPWKDRRQKGRQNRCIRSPVSRGSALVAANPIFAVG